jgi:hypothetical protein
MIVDTTGCSGKSRHRRSLPRENEITVVALIESSSSLPFVLEVAAGNSCSRQTKPHPSKGFCEVSLRLPVMQIKTSW